MKFHNLIHQLKPLALATAFAVGGLSMQAQVATSPERFSPLAKGYIERARTMLQAGNYTGVIDQVNHITTNRSRLSDAELQECDFLLAMALFQRGDDQAIGRLRDFCARYPASPRALDASLALADWFFFNHQWPEALKEYNNVNYAILDKNQLPLYTYRKGLTLIKTGFYNEARKEFGKLAAYPQYTNATTFYDAYLDYIAGDYTSAYRKFGEVNGNEHGLEAAYYMAQINYRLGNFSKAAITGKDLLRSDANPELLPEINRITGLSFYKLDDYSKAQSYLKRYLDLTTDPAPDAVYAYGATKYADGEYDPAAQLFNSLTGLQNDIAQGAWLYLGQCYMQLGDRDAAAIAFDKAAKMSYDPAVTETALYNYIAVLTQGGKVPFSSSVELLEGFIKNYPHSSYASKVKEYLATAYYNERDFAKALASIELISSPSDKILAAKQKVLFELGVAAMTNGRPAQADDFLRRSIALERFDRNLGRQACLWLADALYAEAKYSSAEKFYNDFLRGEPNGANRTLALYDKAYALYQQEQYAQAAKGFKEAIEARPELPASLLADANIRMGDCLYYDGQYRNAITPYTRAIESRSADADYAYFRRAVVRGLNGDVNAKIQELSELSTLFPSSKWLPNAILEKAETLEALDRNTEAAIAFRELAESHPKSTQARKAMISLALSYMKAGKTEEAIEAYKRVIQSWPTSEEASVANDDLKKYYSATGGLGEYALFLRGIPEAKQIEDTEIEQLAYDGAATAFAENPNNIELLQKYVRDFPDGKFVAVALYDIAESLTAAGKRAEALQAWRDLEQTGDMKYLNSAYIGIMRHATDPNESLKYGKLVAETGGVSAQLAEEASLCQAEALIKLSRGEEALPILKQMAQTPSSEAGAKAAVALGEYYFNIKDYKSARESLLDFTDVGTPHLYQLARGFILLADVYAAEGKKSLAKEYLQSLKENYPGKEPDIISAINTRLKSLK